MVRKKLLMTATDFVVSVCRYSPGERHATHTDRFSRIGFLLAGGYREEGRSGSVMMRPGDILLKSRQVEHEDLFGQAGAVIASIEFIEDDPFRGPPDGRSWHRTASAPALRHFTALLEAASAQDVTAARCAGLDLLADDARAETRESNAADWVSDLRQELEERGLSDVDVSVRAREAGVHPAQASRLFRRRYGASITEHARAHAVRRAMNHLAAPGVSLSDAALAAGFYDQSHMNRAFRRVVGRTPGKQRGLFAAALG
jgi:AraC family transcriptional regulator